jgi:hypothetical protein
VSRGYVAAVIEIVVAVGDEEGGHQHDPVAALAERRMTLTTT